MSWRAEVQTAGDGLKWSSNGLLFPTEADATFYVKDLEWRWTAVKATRVVEVDKPASHFWDGADSRARPIAEKPKADTEYDQAFAKFIERKDER